MGVGAKHEWYKTIHLDEEESGQISRTYYYIKIVYRLFAVNVL